MKSKREAIVVYLDLINDDTLNDITDDQLGAIFRAVLKYGKGEDVSASLDLLPRVIFRQIRDGIDRAWEKYNAVCKRNRANGKKGGRPRKVDNQNPLKPKVTQNNPEEPAGYSGLQNDQKNNPHVTDRNPENPTHTHTHTHTTNPAKEKPVLYDNVVSSMYRNRQKPTETERNPEKPTGYFGLPDDDDAYQPDYDQAEAFRGINEDQPF